MKTHQGDLTIDEAMADPLIRKVMRADRVEPRHLESLLRTLASAKVRGAKDVAPAVMATRRYDAATMARCGAACGW